ncbi:YkvI family membrane protein [Luteimonas sp. 22616]|uniref:YkvI family membrane protein n=1 Tax=Luteimonas sp. 22616 TaxID=3453951 RepID=UPI003F851706
MTAKSNWFQRYLLPGFVFQAAVIAGGYATGRELVEFFLPAGPWGGLLGMVVSMLVWSAVLMASFELARVARAYDYRSFFKLLLGRGWFVFEIGYFLLMIVILAVMGAAAGEIFHSLFGLPKLAGSLAMIAATGAMLFFNSAVIEKFLTVSVGYLYLVYFVFVVWSVVAFGDRIAANFASVPVTGNWFEAGVTYAGYNVATIPAVLFCIRHLGRRREALVAGALAGPLGMLPGVVFYIAMMGYYHEIGAEALPSAFLLARLQAPWFEWAFQVAVLLTLVDTGVALLHAINERVAKSYEERRRPMPQALRPAIAVGVMLVAVYAASAVGLVDLIAKGYGTLTWVFLVIYVLPLMTWGVWLLWRRPQRIAAA